MFTDWFFDSARTIARHLRDRRRGVVFHHVPKCGGTSVQRALRFRYLTSHFSNFAQPSLKAVAALNPGLALGPALDKAMTLREEMLLFLLYRDVRCVMGHIRFNETAFREFAAAYDFITLLRPPVSRFVSHYFYGRQQRGLLNITESLDEFVESDLGRRFGCTYSQYYCGLPVDADFRSRTAIEKAKQNLARFAVVGFLDDVPGFVQALRTRTGLRLRIGHHNKGRTPDTQVRDAVTPALRARIEELCAPDLEIYEHALRTFGSGQLRAARHD